MNVSTLLRKATSRQEFYLISVIITFSVIMGFINPAFLSFENFFDVLNNCATLGVMAVGVLLVMISGGMDVSFSAIAAVAMYVTVSVLNVHGGTVFYAFAMAGIIGGLLGLVNASILSYFQISALIITLATSNVFYGLLLQLVPRAHITSIPKFRADFGNWIVLPIISFEDGKTIGLSAIAFAMILVMLIMSIVLRYTSIGRNVYALGGSREAAERAGISIWKTQFFVYCLAGMLAGIASILNVSMIRYVNPFNVYNVLMDVIAAVVLGGAKLSGGSGTIFGTFLGVFTLYMIKNSLILMGIPSTWDSVIVGLIIIVSVAFTASRKKPA